MNTTYSYKLSELDNKISTVMLPCSSCGKPVMVTLPFTGCVFCFDCRSTVTYYVTSNRMNSDEEGERND